MCLKWYYSHVLPHFVGILKITEMRGVCSGDSAIYEVFLGSEYGIGLSLSISLYFVPHLWSGISVLDEVMIAPEVMIATTTMVEEGGLWTPNSNDHNWFEIYLTWLVVLTQKVCKPVQPIDTTHKALDSGSLLSQCRRILVPPPRSKSKTLP